MERYREFEAGVNMMGGSSVKNQAQHRLRVRESVG